MSLSRRFLVLLCHSMDDFPIVIFASVGEAKAFIDANPITECPRIESGLGWNSGPIVMAAYDKAGIDASTPLGFKISEFDEQTGHLISTDLYGPWEGVELVG